MISLGGGIIRCMVLLYGLGKPGRGLIFEQPFRVILSLPQKGFFWFNIGFINFDLFFLHTFYILLWIYITNRNNM